MDKKAQAWLTDFTNYLQQNIPEGLSKEEASEQINTITNSLNEFFDGKKSLDRFIFGFADTVYNTNYKFSDISSKILEYYQSLDPTETFNEVSSSIKEGSPKPVMPSKEEYEKRKELTNILVTSYLQRADVRADLSKKQKEDIQKVVDVTSCPKIKPRNFEAFALSEKPGSEAENRRIIDAFLSKDKKKITDAVNDIYRRHISEMYLFDKKYSDEELAKNWDKLGPICRNAGMEYGSFSEGLKMLGIEPDPELAKKMHEVHCRANAYNCKYAQKVEAMTSGLYAIGNDDNVKDMKNLAMLRSSKNKEIARGASSLMIHENLSKQSFGQYVEGKYFYDKTKIETVYDSDGKVYNVNNANDKTAYGKVIEEGKDLFFVKKGETTPVKISKGDEGFEMGTKEEAQKQLTPEERDKMFNAKMEALENSDLPKPLKDIEESIIYNQYKLALITANPNRDESFKASYKNTVAELAAAISIKKLVEKTNPDGEVLEKLASSKTLKDAAKDIKKSGLATVLTERNLKNPNEAATMSVDELYDNIKDATVKLGEFIKQKGQEKTFEKKPEKAQEITSENALPIGLPN